jgi:curli biogenesis system outer membrane secretion channel CsgG
MMHSGRRFLMLFLCALTGCSAMNGRGVTVPTGKDEVLVKGPAVMDIVTPFDRALSCLDGRINKDALRFSVGSVVDSTGKEQVTDGGAGKFITQGAGDIVQSALFKAGATVVNRRDPRIIENEVKWGLLSTKEQALSTFFITGSINSLDFLPGSGFDVQIAGLGPRYRQNRILVGLDLSMTETRTGRIVANVPLQKQVVATEDGFGIGRFFGKTLVSLDIGGKEREALNLVLRQMLNLATFELLTQVMNPAKYGDCYAMISAVDGVTDNSRSSVRLHEYLTGQARAAELVVQAKAKAKPQASAKADMLDTAGEAAASARAAASATPSAPATTATATPASSAAGAVRAPQADPNADPNAAGYAAQGPYFQEEKSQISAAALKALELQRPARAAAEGAEAGVPAVIGVMAAAAARAAGKDAPSCPPDAGDFPQVTPLRATEPGRSLRIRSRTAQLLCLADQSGRFTPRPLAAGVEQKFEGMPPWRLQAERMKDLDIIYQGLPLRVPGYVVDRMELLERS